MALFYTSNNIQFHEKKINPKKHCNFYTYDFQQMGMKKQKMVVPRLRTRRNKLQRELWGLISIESYEFEKKVGFVTLKVYLRKKSYTDKDV